MTDRRPMPNDGRIGKEIHWSLVIASLTRPVWEPPALEVLDQFNDLVHDASFDANHDTFKAELPDAEQRLRMLDLICELQPLQVYLEWGRETRNAARDAGERPKDSFYDGLVHVLKSELEEMAQEMLPIYNANELGSPISKIGSGLFRSTYGSEGESEVYSSEPISPYGMDSDQLSVRSHEGFRCSSDLEPLQPMSQEQQVEGQATKAAT